MVVTHTKPDFDALASLALARLVHPGARATVTGSIEPQLESFIHLYRDQLDLEPMADIDLNTVTELIVVDTCDPERLGPVAKLIGRVPITLYDHHPLPEGAIPAARGRHQQLGATATILTLLLASKHVSIPAELASLALIGIHEDTGHLRYASTRPEDCEACAYLLRCGASLRLMQEFLREPYQPEHQAFLLRLLDVAQRHGVHGYDVVTACLEGEQYLPEVAPLCNQLLEIHGADAALVVTEMEGRTLVIARARGETIDVGAALADAFGGGGHPSAAFAKSEAPVRETLELALSAFARHSGRAETAATLMSSPVKTVDADATIAEAQALLLRYGHNGLPVVGSGGRLVGVISRRDLERALRHNLGDAKVAGFMAKDVITAAPDASQRELERLIETRNIGRIPVMNNGELVGIVTRSDLVAARHQRLAPKASPEEQTAVEVLDSLPPAAREVLSLVAAGPISGTLYLVGGTVRDALLAVGMQDLDLVVEGDSAERLASLLHRRLGGKLSCHFDFGTCTVELPSGLVIDIATAREEYYPRPGSLPEVSPSTLRKDLSRRDFTVNAIAVRVAPGQAVLVDPFGGIRDLRSRVLRPLHSLSFVEDPTRIIRGARLAGRFGLSFHRDALAQLELALKPDVLAGLSSSRLRAELQLTVAEPRVGPVLEVLDQHGALSAMYGLKLDAELLQALDRQRSAAQLPDESYLLALLVTLEPKRLELHRRRFHWSKRLTDAALQLRAVRSTGEIGDDQLDQLDPASKALIKAFGGELRERIERYEALPRRQKLRGQDVLDLGLAPGPAVGAVLRAVAEARADGEVASYEDELELARDLVRQRTQAAAKFDRE